MRMKGTAPYLMLAFLLCSLSSPIRGAEIPEAQREKGLPPDSLPEITAAFPAEPPSGFEMFLGGITAMTEGQFDVLKKMEGVVYSEAPGPLPDGAIRVPVRIVRERGAEGGKFSVPPGIATAGYLTGRRDAVAKAFSLLGIRSVYSDSRELRQFGYDFFDRAPTSFSRTGNLPVGPGYVIGPGDEIRIAVWGKVDAQYRVTVDREGNIQIPVVGVIGVAGMSYADLKEAIRKELSRFYTGFETNVTLGSLRSMSVFLVGKARSPGMYTVPPDSTLVNVLVATGGPGKAGSLRGIEIRRDGKPVARLDFYEFLLRGNSSGDVRVRQNDIVYIPPVGPLVALSGSIRTPAIYELKGETGLRDLVQTAGGLGPEAFFGRVRIERIIDGKRVEIVEDGLSSAMEKNAPLRDGDFVTVFPVESERRIVSVSGAVQREGEYGLSDGMRVGKLIALAGGLKSFAHAGEAELARVRKGQGASSVEVLAIDLEKALAGDAGHDIPLRDRDRLFVRQVKGAGRHQYATLSGEVRYPGSYSIRDGEKLSSLIERAGGFTEKAYLPGAVFTRERIRVEQQRQLADTADRLEQRINAVEAQFIAGSLNSEDVRLRQAELQSLKTFVERIRRSRATGRLSIRIRGGDSFRGGNFDVELEDGDTLHVPPDPRSVQVVGSVFNPSTFVFDGKAGVAEYLDMAGGMTENSDPKNVFLLKNDGTAVNPGSPSRSSFRLFGGGMGNVVVEPGDTIVVPEKLDRVAWIREFRDLTQILFQVAVTTGVLIVLF